MALDVSASLNYVRTEVSEIAKVNEAWSNKKKRKISKETTPTTDGMTINKFKAPEMLVHSVLVPHDKIQVVMSAGKSRWLVIVRSATTLYFSGFAKFTLVTGSSNINGYSLTCGETRMLRAPSWLPAHRIHLKPTLQRSRPDVSTILKDFDDKIDSQNSVAFIVEESNDLEWLERAEDRRLNGVEVGGILATVTFQLLTLEACQANDIDTLHLPESWVAASNLLLGASNPTIAFCGAKGSGKSTSLRYICNHLLHRCKRVYILDCDLGQPELSIAGVIGLHLVINPLLSPSYLNLDREPILSFFLGDVTTKNIPELFVDAVTKLYEKFQVHERSLLNSDIRQNSFEALDDSSGERFALLVNCDGFIRYTGAEILGAIFNIVQPDYIIQLVTSKDPKIDVVENKPASCKQVIRVDPGRTSPSTILPSDLRNLRYISYFLGKDEVLRGIVDSQSDEGIRVRRGAVLDPSGHLALAMLRLHTYAVPFTHIVWKQLGDDCPERLTLSAFNASLVGLCEFPQTSSSRSVRFSDSSSGRSFDLFFTDEATLHCFGAGIVRAIDIEASCIYLSTNSQISCERISLLLGAITLPLSLVQSPQFPCFLHTSSEVFGDGNNVMKPRPNIKRRSQRR